MIPSGLSDEEKQIVSEIMTTIAEIKDDDTLPENVKNKIYVCCAYEYFIMDWEEEGMRILKSITTPEYFSKTLGEQMRQDESYAFIIKKIAQKLIECGHVIVLGK